MRTRTSVVTFVLLFHPYLPVEADINAGIEAYKQGDYATALREFSIPANEGFPEAQFNLGLLYEKGHGVPQDYATAALWYRQAAEQDMIEAQNNLGYLYNNGLGVPLDYAEAALWYHRAAEQDIAGAQYNLGELYWNGLGVPQNYSHAYKWSCLAAINLPAGADQRKAARRCHEIASLLTPAQLEEAVRLLRERKLSRQEGKH
jgi:TPR repeat protein